jgi:serine/threonine-protein kinase
MGAASEEAKQEAPKQRVPQPGEILADKYRVERVVGVGGMGVVVAAQHLQLGQSVAIKLLSTEENRRGEATARFEREGRAAAGLRSDHVVRIYDVGALADGSPFMVMELLRGTDLANLLEEHGSLPVAHAVEFVLQACDAIGEAHALGIVHRDLKPSNLFITRRSDGIAMLKVLDFGISKALRSETDGVQGDLTQTRSVMGSPYYMSPEQVRDAKKVDGRTDIWALGVILHELITGAPAFHADTFPGICAAIVADEPADIRVLRPDVPPELIAIINRCLEKDPRRRYQDVSELVQALTPFAPRGASTMPTLAAPPGSLPRSAQRALMDAPTISLPADFDPAASARSARTPSSSGQAFAGSQSGAQPISVPHSAASRAAEAPSPASRTRFGLLLGAAFVLGIAVAIALALTSGEHPPAPAAEAPRRAFNLFIESTPPGAQVMENGQPIGTTPLALSIELASVKQAPRSFTLLRSGFLPYSVRQGSSDEDVRVLATLLPEPAPAVEPALRSSASTPPQPVVRPASRPARPGAKATPKATAAQAPPAASDDIRMQR